MDKFTALNYNVIITDIETENRTQSGIKIAPEASADEKQRTGIVQAAGLSCPKTNVTILGIPIPFLYKRILKKGDIVMYDRHKSTPITINAVTYSIVYFSDLILIK